MSSKANIDRKNDTLGELESLYHEFVKRFYEHKDRKRAEPVANRLEALLAASPDCAETIRGEEIRSLIAQFHGDLTEAIQSREAEIRKILELHTLSVNTPSWKYVSRKYDFADVSDRLDLLAILYDERGELDRAIAVLTESKRYCETHEIPFDAPDLLEELVQARTSRAKPPLPRTASLGDLDDAIRQVYPEFDIPADEIIVNDKLSRNFTRVVSQLLPEAVTIEEVRRRLLALRRRGEKRGGLQRIRR